MKTFSTILAILLLIAAPLGGAYLAGYSIDAYLVFPPRNIGLQPAHAPFSLPVFMVMMVAILVVIMPFFVKVFITNKRKPSVKNSSYPFPSWGWVGFGIAIIGWVLAWTRFPWFEAWQTHTFTPLWVGYVIVINALTYMRSGRSLLTHRPGFILILFLCSAVFWWYFEYLNLFVENWYYVNVEHLGPQAFFWYATIPFATVLPAVMSTKELLSTFPGFSAGLDNFVRLPVPYHRLMAGPLMLLAALALALSALLTDYLYYMLWLAPLIIIVAGQVLAGKPTLFAGISRGQWKQLYLWGMAALLCGFFWEMWNFYSYTRWEYAIPFVEGVHIFEMPLPGYAGYLPFGLQCGVVCGLIDDIVSGNKRNKVL